MNVCVFQIQQHLPPVYKGSSNPGVSPGYLSFPKPLLCFLSSFSLITGTAGGRAINPGSLSRVLPHSSVCFTPWARCYNTTRHLHWSALGWGYSECCVEKSVFKSPALDLSALFCSWSAGWNLFESFCDIFLIDVVLVNQHHSSKSCSPTLTSCLCGYITLHYRICWNSWWCCLFKKTVWWRLNVSINVSCSNRFTKAQIHTLKYECC